MVSEREEKKSERGQEKKPSFRGISIVSCGTLRMELKQLQEEGFLDAHKIFFTTPGLHEVCSDLKEQVIRQVKRALEVSDKIIVVYGSLCYVDPVDMSGLDKLLGTFGSNVLSIKAQNCVDALAGRQEREEIAAGRRIFWLTPGWMRFKDLVFKDWDIGKINENFPKNDAAIVLDALGYYDKLMEEDPMKILEYSDWMHLGVEAVAVTLDRFKGLLLDQLQRLR
jgi:hypothetical protein